MYSSQLWQPALSGGSAVFAAAQLLTTLWRGLFRQRWHNVSLTVVSVLLPQLRSGDADIPLRQPLHQRRAVFDAVAARRSAAAGSDEDDEGLHTKKRRSEPAGEEDEFYAASKAARAEAKAAKRSKHEVPQLAPPLPDPEATGQRKISYEIEKNRGLTPHRCVRLVLRCLSLVALVCS